MLVLATAVWIGGLVAIFVVASVAHATSGAGERVAFFRRLGRAYGLADGTVLTMALASGAVLASAYRWDGQLTASAVVAAALVAATVAGMAQAADNPAAAGCAARLWPPRAGGEGAAGRAERRRPARRDRRAQPGAPRPRGRDRNMTSSLPATGRAGPFSLT